MGCENSANDVLADADTEGQGQSARQCVGIPNVDFAVSISTTARIRSEFGLFGPGLVPRFAENRSRYFRWDHSAMKKLRSDDGFTTKTDRTNRLGSTSTAHNPAIRFQSEVREIRPPVLGTIQNQQLMPEHSRIRRELPARLWDEPDE